MNAETVFDEHRPLLFGIAYRMLGSVADAEDVVQDAYLRFRQAGEPDVQAPRAYLSTIVTRLCLDRLRSAQRQRETYVGPWLPEPLVTGDDPARQAELSDALSTAFLLLLERLSPLERAVFLLHEVFDYDYAEIAGIVGRREDYCRQIASRARKHLAAERPRFEASRAEQERLVREFTQASTDGDLDGLLALLDEDVVLHSDGGGKAKAALKPIRGADRVARFMIGIRKKTPTGTSIRFTDVNGLPGMVVYVDGRVQSTWSFDVSDGRIRALYAVVNPEKLRHIEA